MKAKLIFLFLLLSTAVFAETKVQYTDLYEVPEEWCRDLYITVAGVDISSNDYYLLNCGESGTANQWYCNCDTDEDFDLVFVNKFNDYKSYVIDIISGGNKVKRAISKNKLFENTSLIIDPIRQEESLNLGNKLIDIENKLNSINPTLASLQTQITNIDTSPKTETIIVEYNDTEVKNALLFMANKKDRTGSGLSLVLVLMFGFYIYYNERRFRK